MNAETLIYFLTQASTVPTVGDIHWNDVRLLLRLDKEANSLGLPLYRDYSRYQYPVRAWTGDAPESLIQFLSNDSLPAGIPSYQQSGDINVESFCYIPNYHNQALRLTELNVSDTRVSKIKPSFLEVLCAGLDNLNLGTGDFTIEFSFFADSVSLPVRWQTLWCANRAILRANGINPPLSQIKTYIDRAFDLQGWGCFLKDNNLVFIGRNWEIQINTAPIQAKTWYTVCLQRTSGVLKTYLNTIQTTSQPFTESLTVAASSSYDNKIRIGCSQLYVAPLIGGSIFYDDSKIDISFSGGFSNFRITSASRYDTSFYTAKLPHPVISSQNKIDQYYPTTLFNLPFSYDFYNYASNKIHFKNKAYLQQTPDIQHGFLPITGLNSYETNIAATSLSSSEWTIEFYICKTIDYEPELHLPYVYDISSESPFSEWLIKYRVRTIANQDFTTPINLLTLKSGNKNVLAINFNVVASIRVGGYFSLKASSNGDDWLNFPFDENIDWNSGINFGYYPYLLPNNECKFYPSYNTGTNIPNLEQDSTHTKKIIPSGYDPNPKHIAISRYNNLLYILVDGAVVKTVPFDYTLFQQANNLKLVLCAESFQEIIGSTSSENVLRRLGVAIKGVRITNTARYSFNSTNAVHNLHSLQPLPIDSDDIAPARARVVALQRTVTNPTVSSTEVTWNVYLSQPVDGLVINDFTLSGVGGISGYSLTNLTKTSEYVYRVTASTGTGNGELTLNFIDRRTLKYKGTNNYISYFETELDMSGETYSINKNAPIPFLTSGSSPYINSDFVVRVTFDATIENFYVEKIGVMNGAIVNVQTIGSLGQEYDITIQPVREGIVTVQCLEGTGVTDTNLASSKSAPLTRIFSSAFPILQLPLNIANTLYDLSPSRLTLEEVIPNNTEFSTVVFPVGETSSLSVIPNLEQSGLVKPNFNALNSTINITELEWTIEFFLRIDSSVGSKKTHILSVENPSTGFCIISDNKKLKLQRTVNSTGNLLGSTLIDDIATPTYVEWNNPAYTQLEKFPHFALTFKDGVYRWYINGRRVALIQSTTLIDISKGDIYVGYYPNFVNNVPFLLSNVRLTVGKALYTSFEVNVPGLPYTVLPNITDATELLSYISIYSNNVNSALARTTDTVILKFKSIITLVNAPTVTILGRTASVVNEGNNTYSATLQIENGDADGEVPFNITIAGEPNLPTKTFDNTTNNSSVFVDNSALTVSIGTEVENTSNEYVIEAYITFSEPIRTFNYLDLTATNCKLGNFRKITDANKYYFTITGLSSGNIEVNLPANKVQDLAGNYNLVSNTFSRSVIVPAYVPDQYFSNVIFLLQPTTSITDSSSFNRTITATNVTLSNQQNPQGLSNSLFFNGVDSSISFNLAHTLDKTESYTIEFFAYFQSSTVFRLAKPDILPANNVTTSSFRMNWEPVTEANAYVVDVSTESNFNAYLPGYKKLTVGDVTSIDVSGDSLDTYPKLNPIRVNGSTGFVGEWEYTGDFIAYKYDIALDANFSTPLYLSNRHTKASYNIFGQLTNWKMVDYSPVLDDVDTNNPINTSQGVILAGLLSNANYPRLMYFLEESSIRVYPKEGYVRPAIAEDIDIGRWYHVALVNSNKYTFLYVDGQLIDKVKNTGFSSAFDLGYTIGHFHGYLTGLRITKGIQRYTGDTYEVPTLPFSRD